MIGVQVDIFLQCVSVDENLLLKARIGVENLKNKQLISVCMDSDPNACYFVI